jgi:hypothetical protein
VYLHGLVLALELAVLPLLLLLLLLVVLLLCQ